MIFCTLHFSAININNYDITRYTGFVHNNSINCQYHHSAMKVLYYVMYHHIIIIVLFLMWLYWVMDYSQHNGSHFAVSDIIATILHLCCSPTDNEYLHKSKDGNVFLHNLETMASSLYLSNSTFVSCLYMIHIIFSFHRMYYLLDDFN